MKSKSLFSNLRRYAVALIVSIALPLGGLLIYVFDAERRRDAVHREITFYHLRTQALAREAHERLVRLRSAKKLPVQPMQAKVIGLRDADARIQIQSLVDEIEQIEREFGCERCSVIIDRLGTEWGRIVNGFRSEDSVGPLEKTWDSCAIALLQLERVHKIEADEMLADLRGGGWLSLSRMVMVGAVVVLVSGGLARRIYVGMRKMAGDIDEGTAALRESEERFRQLAENIEAVFWMADVSTNDVLFVSKGCEKVWGQTVESLKGNPEAWIETIVPEDRDAIFKRLAKLSEGNACLDEYRIKRTDGSISWIRDRGFPVRDEEGNVVRLAGVAVDVTEEKRAQDQVRLSEGHLRSLMESAEGFVVLRVERDPSNPHGGRVIFVSPIVEEIMGISDPFEFGSYIKGIHEDDLAAIVAALRRMSEDCVPLNEDFRHFHPGREDWRWLRVIATPVHDVETEQYFFNAIIIDITEEVKAKEELEKAVEEVEKLKELAEAENVYLREEMRQRHLHGDIVGKSEALRSVLVQAERVARTDSTVLLLGETGTGKEMVARAIYRMSGRSGEPLITVNCAAIPEKLVESELFGREKGAYTGATTSQKGRFESADGGTIFLDEVGELPEAMQAKLLRVLQEGQFERLGSAKTIRVDVRVIAATNRDLAERVREGTFREDLYYRLSVFPIEIPALRERREDIPLLARHFVKEFAEKMGKKVEKIGRRTMEELESYSWPGNVRELRNLIERGMILATGEKLQIDVAQETAGNPNARKSKELA